MKQVLKKINSLTRRKKTSIIIVNLLVGIISTIMSIVGITVNDITNNDYVISVLIVIITTIILYVATYFIIGVIYKNSVEVTVRQTEIKIKCGNIFSTNGLRVIGCDNKFNTKVDDIVIAKKSLHGQLIINHGKENEIKQAIKNEAIRLDLMPDENGLYTFPLGSIVKYESSVDGNTYLMLAMAELDENLEVHTNMADYENMLMRMWKEISRVYAMNDIALPLLGAGIMRFDDGPKSKESLLRCMLCTLNGSGVSLKSNVSIVIYGDNNDIPLYEYKDLFRSTWQ